MLVREVIDRYAAVNRNRRISLTADPVEITGDLARLDQVVANLVDNALKYSPAETPVSVEVRRVPGGAQIEVQDSGIGLVMHGRHELFEPFGRGANVAEFAGMGLGLYITRQIVNHHGGKITARSAGPGQGSVFRVTLPTQPPPARNGSQ
jgi:signal transduction histidine kinase